MAPSTPKISVMSNILYFYNSPWARAPPRDFSVRTVRRIIAVIFQSVEVSGMTETEAWRIKITRLLSFNSRANAYYMRTQPSFWITENLQLHQSELCDATIYTRTKSFPFQIVYKDGLLYVYASNEESRSQWLKALQKGNLKRHKREPSVEFS